MLRPSLMALRRAGVRRCAALAAAVVLAAGAPAPVAAAPGSYRQSDAAVGTAASGGDELTGPLTTPQSGPGSGGGRGVIYFGIDDGPSCRDKVTWGMLDLFADYGARATWFVTASVNCDPAALPAILEGGHAVGNHTYGHESLARLSHTGRLATFDRLQAAVTRYGGPRLTCYRPPYGDTNSSVRYSAAQRGMVEWLWNVDPRDWSDPGVSSIVRTFNSLEDGDVVVIHDGNSNQQTLDALRIWLPANVDRFEFRPLPGCAVKPRLCQGVTATVVGTPGDDTLHGTAGNDVIWAGPGNDKVYAGGGDDLICAGPGDDVVHGGSGSDKIHGGSGADRLYGGEGDDTAWGGPGDDRLWGGAGKDTLRGGAGADIARGGPGNDTLWGGAGNDTLRGGAGADVARGGPGDDRLWGGAGKDTLRGGAGHDMVQGNQGPDALWGGTGKDTLHGNRGRDALRGGAGRDICGGGAGVDTAKGCETTTGVP